MSNFENLRQLVEEKNGDRFARIIKVSELERLYRACALARTHGITDLRIDISFGVNLAYWSHDWVQRKREQVLSTELVFDGARWFVSRRLLTPSNPGVNKREVTCRFEGDVLGIGWEPLGGGRWRYLM